MKKPSTWSLVGYVVGFLFSLFSAVRYFLIWPDLDRAIVYTLIGVIIMALSWLYNRQLNLSNTVTAIEDYLAEEK